MAILKGQNFRILTYTGTKYTCVAMATNCTVTLTNNTEDSSTKDDVGMASKPTTVSQGWSVSVDSLDVSDVGAMLTACKSLTKFTLIWDETDTDDNQTGVAASFRRKGTAYLNDITINFNDRENSSKSIQFTGTGALEAVTTTLTYQAVSASAYTKGQFVRLFVSDDNSNAPTKVIGAAKQLSLHVSTTLEDSTTKDTQGNWQNQEPTGISYDITSNALVRGGDTITSGVGAQGFSEIEAIYQAGSPVKWQIANVSGNNQRTKGSIIVSGSALLTQLSVSAQNRANATYDAQLSGYGTYTVGA